VSNGKILIIHQGAIGDLILSLPAITALQERFTNYIFSFMGYPSTLELLPVEREQIVSVQMPGFSSLYTREPDPPEELKQYLVKFEKVFIFGMRSGEDLVKGMKVIGVKEVFRIDTFPDHCIHVTDYQASILSSLGTEVKNRVPRLFISDQDEKLAGEVLLRHGVKEDKPLIFIHPGSGSIKKSWPSHHFAKLARNLQERFSARIAVIEGPADRAQAETLSASLKGSSTVKIGKLPLRTLAVLLKRGKCFIGNDSGITHLAAAVGTPSIALFGPTDPGVWGPRGENVSIIRGETDCSPCTPETLRGCTRQKCFENISVETVCDAVQKLVSEGLGSLASAECGVRNEEG